MSYNVHVSYLQDDGDTEGEEDDVLDSQGIPGWDKVYNLARALLQLEGLGATMSQATNIKRLYDDLLEFDKRPIVFKPRPVRPTRGRFARKKTYR